MAQSQSTNSGSHAEHGSADAEAVMNDVAERVETKLDEARESAIALSERARDFIRENPGTALLGVAGFGFLIGRLASRK